MAKIDKKQMQESYRLWVLENGKVPPSVFAFCQHVGIQENEFYNHFGSLKGLEESIWAGWVETTLTVIADDEETASYDAKQKLLAFLYTFLEEGKSIRSFLLIRFPRFGKCGLQSLKPMKAAFEPFAENWVKQAVEEGHFSSNIRAEDWVPSLLFPKLLGVVQFYLEDESPAFERTDALVEKAVRLFFDLASPDLIDSGLDFLRFIAGTRRAPSQCSSSKKGGAE